MSVSILIMTLNEEMNLPGALESVAWSDDVVVYDSISTDRTQEIAREHGARVIERKFDNFGAHQTWAMKNIDWKHRWVFMLDADERMTPELRTAIEAVARAWESGEKTIEKKDPVAYYCGRRNYFRGVWIKHAMPPGNNMRFYQPTHIAFEREVHQVPVTDGAIGYLSEMFVHYNFSKGLAEWMQRHNKYSSTEARETMRALAGEPVRLGNLFSADRNTRRLEIKNLAHRLPFRPTLRFLYMYVFKLGFLDGMAGLDYCLLLRMYEWQIVMKVKELKRIERGLPGS